MVARRALLCLSIMQCMLFLFIKLNQSRHTTLIKEGFIANDYDYDIDKDRRMLGDNNSSSEMKKLTNSSFEINETSSINETISVETKNDTTISSASSSNSSSTESEVDEDEEESSGNYSAKETAAFEKFRTEIANFTKFSGLYEGAWYIGEDEESTSITPKFEQKTGKAHFEFEFNKVLKISHINVYGLIYSGDFRNNEVQMEFFLNPLYNHTIDQENGTINMKNVNVTLVKKSELKILDILICQMDIQIDANLQQIANSEQQQRTSPEDDEELILDKIYKIRMILNQTNPNSTCFPHTMKISLKTQSVDELMEKISNYSFFITAICMIYVYCILGQIKKCSENNASAQSLSLSIISFNIIWNFCYFTIHFEIAFQKTYYHYLALPSFWYFMICFVFEFRLLMICWKAQNQELLRQDAQIIRKKLIYFYCRFYFSCLLIYVLHSFILFTDSLLLIFNGSIWLPQIYRTYKRRSRIGPEMYFVYMLTVSHTFFPVYLRGCPFNLFDRQPSYLFMMVFVAYLIFQVMIVKQQQLRNPRFFVPRKWRLNPNAYNYFYKFPKEEAHADQERQEIQEDEDCIICMNSLRYEVDSSGGNIAVHNDVQTSQIKAKQYMKTPCNHKYHIACLKKWMEIRLECPACRQAIPAIEEDD